jgi:hypothetical protein
MRQLFVPACLCLMTWTGSVGSDLSASYENFSGFSTFDKSAEASVPRTEIVPTQENLSSPVEISSNFTGPSDTLIDIPVQTGFRRTLEPQQTAAINKPVVHRSRQEVCDALAKAAQSNNLPIPFFIRLLFQESRFKPDVVSRAGAQGVAQFMPETSVSIGLDNPFDPLQAIPASARLLRGLFQQFGNLGLAAAAYNAGPKRIQEWLTKKGKLPQETQGYVKTITGRPAETWKVTEAGNSQMRLPRRAPCQREAGLLAWNGPNRIPVPRSSPLTRATSAQIQVATRTSASTAEFAPYRSRITDITKTEERAVAFAAHSIKNAVQLAVRKRTANETKLNHKPGEMDHNTARKPIEFAMVARSSRK